MDPVKYQCQLLHTSALRGHLTILLAPGLRGHLSVSTLNVSFQLLHLMLSVYGKGNSPTTVYNQLILWIDQISGVFLQGYPDILWVFL